MHEEPETMSLPARNLELKVALPPGDQAEVMAVAERLSCQPVTTMHQEDRYFAVASGRLKLRSIREKSADSPLVRVELIAYERQTQESSRWSDYVVIPVPVSAASSLRAALDATHDTLTTVRKERRVVIVGQTRIHLDKVEGLGTFVELETVMSGQGDDAARREHEEIVDALALGRFDPVGGSYLDLARDTGDTSVFAD